VPWHVCDDASGASVTEENPVLHQAVQLMSACLQESSVRRPLITEVQNTLARLIDSVVAVPAAVASVAVSGVVAVECDAGYGSPHHDKPAGDCGSGGAGGAVEAARTSAIESAASGIGSIAGVVVDGGSGRRRHGSGVAVAVGRDNSSSSTVAAPPVPSHCAAGPVDNVGSCALPTASPVASTTIMTPLAGVVHVDGDVAVDERWSTVHGRAAHLAKPSTVGSLAPSRACSSCAPCSIL
jgi:hypothetical protein